jgi:hypothetical protein
VEADGMMVLISLDLTEEGSVSGGMIHDVFLTFVLVVRTDEDLDDQAL